MAKANTKAKSGGVVEKTEVQGPMKEGRDNPTVVFTDQKGNPADATPAMTEVVDTSHPSHPSKREGKKGYIAPVVTRINGLKVVKHPGPKRKG